MVHHRHQDIHQRNFLGPLLAPLYAVVGALGLKNSTLDRPDRRNDTLDIETKKIDYSDHNVEHRSIVVAPDR